MKTLSEWVNECIYIERVTAANGRVPEMNGKTSIFLSYCQMQRNCAEREGFHDAAQYIQHCIDDLQSA